MEFSRNDAFNQFKADHKTNTVMIEELEITPVLENKKLKITRQYDYNTQIE